MTIGLVSLLDSYGVSLTIYVQQAVSLPALESYARFLNQYSTAQVKDIQWDDDGRVSYDKTQPYENRLSFTFSKPTQKKTLNLPGDPRPGYALYYVAAIKLRATWDQKGRQKQLSIPAPISDLFLETKIGRGVRPEAGQAFAAAYTALTNIPVVFTSGYFRARFVPLT